MDFVLPSILEDFWKIAFLLINNFWVSFLTQFIFMSIGSSKHRMRNLNPDWIHRVVFSFTISSSSNLFFLQIIAVLKNAIMKHHPLSITLNLVACELSYQTQQNIVFFFHFANNFSHVLNELAWQWKLTQYIFSVFRFSCYLMEILWMIGKWIKSRKTRQHMKKLSETVLLPLVGVTLNESFSIWI